MPIAYLIRAHQRPGQLARLVDRLRTPSARFFIHVSDRTSEETYRAMRDGVSGSEDVRWLPRIRAYYGGFSVVHAMLIGIDAILREEPLPTHAIMLSGQDYPLRPAAEIERSFAATPETSYLHHFRLPAFDQWPGENGGLDRINRYYVERFQFRTRLLRIPFVRRRFPPSLTPYGGSAWWALTPRALAELDRFAKTNHDALDFFRHVKMPDEIFVQSVLMSSPVADSIVNEEIHHVEWLDGAHPATFTAADLERLLGSGKPFARKFDTRIDGEILDLIDRDALQAARAAHAAGR
jgi:Core-2/I-Branching enzyme